MSSTLLASALGDAVSLAVFLGLKKLVKWLHKKYEDIKHGFDHVYFVWKPVIPNSLLF